MWWNEFNSVFWITVLTVLTGSIGLALKFCLKSKCRNFSCCWGLIQVRRDVDIEAQEEMRELELRGISPHRNDSINNINTNQDIRI